MLELIKLEQTTAAKCGACLLQFGSSPAFCQMASLRGQVFDQSGAMVPKATVTLTGSSVGKDCKKFS
jgi:hypothetical protein